MRLLLVLVLIVVGLVVVIARRPSEFRIERTTIVAAPPAAVFTQVNDFHKWDAWNPWAKMDPALKQSYEGAPAGAGAVYTWAGNRQVGEGRMTIVESRPHDLIRVRLEFLKPFANTSLAEFTVQAARYSDGRDVEHDRHQQLHGRGVPPGDEHGQDDRRTVPRGSRDNQPCGAAQAEPRWR